MPSIPLSAASEYRGMEAFVSRKQIRKRYGVWRMEALKQKILKDGRALNEHVLLVDSFLNHQVDAKLMAQVGDEFARLFEKEGITRIMTVESSGIAPAAMTALRMELPLVIMKKSSSRILSDDTLQTQVHSFTKNSDYQLTIKKKYICPGDRVLVIDDFLANGEAAFGAARLIEEAGATVAGIGIVIEKAFQPGGQRLAEAGYKVVSLARVSKMSENHIEFCD
jgi:xanthine phosphoribosyltransferase